MAETDADIARSLWDKIKTQTQFRRWDQKLNDFSHVTELLESSLTVQREAILLLASHVGKPAIVKAHYLDQTVSEVANRLLRRQLPLSERDVRVLLDSAKAHDELISGALAAAERYVGENGVIDAISKAVEPYQIAITESYRTNQEKQKLLTRIAGIRGESHDTQIHVDANEPWALRLVSDLEQLADDCSSAMRRLIAHAATASGGKPTAKWRKATEQLAGPIPDELVRASLKVWIAAFDQPRTSPSPGHYSDSEWLVAELNADLMKGLIWLATSYADDELTRTIGRAGLSGQRKIPQIGPRSTKVTNAAIWSLGQIDSSAAIGQLAILRSKITNKSVQKQIDKAIDAVAERIGVPADEVEEMAVPTYGLTEVGKRVEQLGDFTAELVVTGTTSTELRWLKPDGKQQKSVPKAVKDDHADELKDLKAAAKDIQKILPAQRDRIDLLHLKQKSWPYATWAERYLDHPLVGTLARRLIWVFDEGGEQQAAVWLDGGFVDAEAGSVSIDPQQATVSLWHPIGHDQESIVAWRKFFEDRELRQPFKQAHREVYLLTDAERNTGVYSNRFASHIIKQHQYNALCAIRGWTNRLRLCVDDEYPPTFIRLPEWGLRAEFWVEGVGDEYGVDTDETGVYLYLATDQVRFYTIDAGQVTAHAGGGGYAFGRWNNSEEAQPLPLEEIPPLVLSEVMRDVDLFVGVASVANDPTWQDGGREGRYRDYWSDYSFGDLNATAQTRREILGRLVPRLKIAERCSLDDRFLVVRGDKRTYKIHLGSSNILMEPNDQYLCIVPGRGAGPGDKVFLPFEGDARLAVILSKAMMLADDTKIKDTTILSQIG